MRQKDANNPLLSTRSIPFVSLIVYTLFIPATLCCSVHLIFQMLMCILGFLAIVLKLYYNVDRQVAELRGLPDPAVVRCPLLQDLLSVVRALAITVVPVALATFGGGACVFNEHLVATATDCSVAQLPALAAQGWRKFHCADGFIAVDLQVGVAAWKDGAADHGTGYVAPIFLSRQAHRDGQAPVAWAVKAGSVVREPWCDGTCGFFATALQQQLSVFAMAPRRWFGEVWGFNLTHFSSNDMHRAVDTLRSDRDWPALGAGASEETFIVTETVSELFRTGYECMWVMITLFGVGLLDVLREFANTRVRAEEDVSPAYVGMVSELNAQGGLVEDGPLLDQVVGFWQGNDKTGHWHTRGGPE